MGIKQGSRQKKVTKCIPLVSAGLLLVFLFDPEDGSYTFLRTVGNSPNYTALQFGRQ
jgi:hypothetical protein